MQGDDWNRTAVQALLADTDRALALAEAEGVRGSRRIVEDATANAHSNYIDLLRRSRPLIMTDGDQVAFQKKLDRLRACLRTFGVPV
jgi:hypothetical protein